MDIKKLQRVIVDGLEDVKAQNIVVFDTEHLSSLFERVIIASGTSNRQTKALAASVREAVKQAGQVPPRVEGEVNGEWIIVDCGSAVVHLMQPNIREYYHLEEIWGDKPVKMKLDTAPRRLVKAEEPAAPAKKSAAKKTAAKKAPALKTAAPVVAGKAAPKSAAKAPAKVAAKAAPAKKTPARKTPAAAVAAPVAAPVAKRRSPVAKPGVSSRAAAPVKSGVTRTVGVKVAGAAAKPAPARKTAGGVAPSARVASKSAPVKTMVVNKPVARKVAAKAPAKAPAKTVPARKTSRNA